MSSYHDSFTYKNKNSFTDMNLIISSFEPDDGFMDTFLSMDPVFEESFDGSKIFSYGAKYNTQAKINITLVKKDGSDFSIQEFRNCARWLTGARTDSWMDMYIGPLGVDDNNDNIDDNIVYSFLGKVTNLQQRKLDGRTVGLQVEFSSVAPWAFSGQQSCNCSFGQSLIFDNGMIYTKSKEDSELSVDEDGILYAGLSSNVCFNLMDEQYYDGVINIDNAATVRINNFTDDLYTYINLDVKFTNENSQYLSIKNQYNIDDDTLIEEETKVVNMAKSEVVLFSSGQFITSEKLIADLSVNENTVGVYFVEDLEQLSGYRKIDLSQEKYRDKDENGAQILYYHYMPDTSKIFGDDFNFVWPRLAPGLNIFTIAGGGSGHVQFVYRYPMKIGDCAIDVDKLHGYCE